MGTIGELEQKAGIGSSTEARTAFWLQFHHLDGKACLDAGVAELNRLIAERNAMALSSGKTRREALPELDGEQVAALQAYAARHGRRWKASLTTSGWTAHPTTMVESSAACATRMVQAGFSVTGCPRHCRRSMTMMAGRSAECDELRHGSSDGRGHAPLACLR